MSSDREARLEAEIEALRARVAALERAATERRQAGDAIGREREASRRQSEATAHAFLESAAESIIVVNRAGEIVLVNARTELMFDYRRGELIGQTLELLLPESVRAAHVQHRTAYFAEPRVRRMGKELVLAGRRRDGTQFPVEISLSYVDTPAGILAMAFVTDITERVDLQRAARQSEKLAALGTLASGIAHEINNPLGIISSRIEVMLLEAETEPLPPSLVDDLLTVHRHAERVARIAQGLLSFSRQSSTEMGTVDLNRVVEDTVLLARGQIEKSGIAIEMTLTPALPAVRGNPNALSQVVLNLLTNARDAMPGGGRVAIVTSLVPDENGAVEIVVSDTGHGMNAATQARIFEPFFTTKELGKGTGLGLATVYGIVKQSGGYIWVYSEPARGTTFQIYLPRVEEPLEDLHARAPAEPGIRGTETLLLVEDEGSVRTLSRTILESRGYTVLEASGPREALETARRHEGPIHLVVTDVVMPEMSGWDLAAELSSLRPGVRVLYMSGYSDRAVAEGSVFLQKPFTPDVLGRKVREALS